MFRTRRRAGDRHRREHELFRVPALRRTLRHLHPRRRASARPTRWAFRSWARCRSTWRSAKRRTPASRSSSPAPDGPHADAYRAIADKVWDAVSDEGAQTRGAAHRGALSDAKPTLPFRKEMKFDYGEVTAGHRPLIRRVVAKNPSPFTLHGTNTYIVGRGEVAVIDPGPASPEHVDALARALAGERVTHILVTHTHMDHSPAAALLQARRSAGKIVGALPRPLPAGAPPVESIQPDFAPDIRDRRRRTGRRTGLDARGRAHARAICRTIIASRSPRRARCSPAIT